MSIHSYAKKGDIEGLKAQLAKGELVDEIDRENLTPLMHAVKSSKASHGTVRFLIENGADVNADGGFVDCKTVLGYAVREGDIEKIKILLKAGADATWETPGGNDILCQAVRGHTLSHDDDLYKIVCILVENGAKPGRISDDGESALFVALDNGRFDVVRLLLEKGADYNLLQWTKLMHAIALGSTDEVRACIENNANLSVRDARGRTPWLLSLLSGNIKKAKLLLNSGAGRNDKGPCGITPLMYPIIVGDAKMLNWLLDEGSDINETDEFDQTALYTAIEYDKVECAKLLIKKGSTAEGKRSINVAKMLGNVGEIMKSAGFDEDMFSDIIPKLEEADIGEIDEKLIENATSVEMVKVLLEAGHDLNDVSSEMRRILVGLDNDTDLDVSKEVYLAGRQRRYGKTNPEVMNVEFWKAMVRSGDIAYRGRENFGDSGYDEPVWTFECFGKSITELPDGRFVEIAGEHEDYYDEDFCIYNDVVVHNGDGAFVIYGYPKEVFPPTDFHTATLVGNYIYIIGSLGYHGERNVGHTPVYKLDCETFKIEKMQTTGDNPGWISRHRAFLDGDSKIYVTSGDIFDEKGFIKNNRKYGLDLQNMTWAVL